MSAELIERLRGLCIDWNGEPIVDGSTPRIETSCGELRQAADRMEWLEIELAGTQDALDEIATELQEICEKYGAPGGARRTTFIAEKLVSQDKRIAELRETLKYCEAQWSEERGTMIDKIQELRAALSLAKSRGRQIGREERDVLAAAARNDALEAAALTCLDIGAIEAERLIRSMLRTVAPPASAYIEEPDHG